jgi:hypothetical protein
VLAAFFLILLTLGVATSTAESRDRGFLVLVVILAWLVFLPMLSLINAALPFSGEGDDLAYFNLAATRIDSIADALDLTRFSDVMEQPGFPLLLNVTS